MSGQAGTLAFLALPPDPAWAESASRLLESLRPPSPPAAWTKPSAWHLTVHFLGNAGAEELRSFAGSISAAAARARPGELPAGGAAVFPPRGPARVLAVGFAPSAALEHLGRLASAARSAAKEIGLQVETRPFRPHVTLARIRDRWSSAAVARFRSLVDGWPFPAWTMTRCVLYASRLGRDGASHAALAEWSLGRSAAAERTA